MSPPDVAGAGRYEPGRARRISAANLSADRPAQPGAGADRAGTGADRRSPAAGPPPPRPLQQTRGHPQPHRALAAALSPPLFSLLYCPAAPKGRAFGLHPLPLFFLLPPRLPDAPP